MIKKYIYRIIVKTDRIDELLTLGCEGAENMIVFVCRCKDCKDVYKKQNLNL